MNTQARPRLFDRFRAETMQIMTPFYVGDPAEPKTPQSDAWMPGGQGQR